MLFLSFFPLQKGEVLKAFLVKSRECSKALLAGESPIKPRSKSIAMLITCCVRKGCQRGTFSLMQVTLPALKMQYYVAFFFWSSKLLEANKLGEVLPWHLDKRKHISSTLCSSFSIVDFCYTWWIFSPCFIAREYQREDHSQILPQHHGDQGTVPGLAHAEDPTGGGCTLTLKQESAREALSQPSAHVATGSCPGGAGGGTPAARCLQR